MSFTEGGSAVSMRLILQQQLCSEGDKLGGASALGSRMRPEAEPKKKCACVCVW